MSVSHDTCDAVNSDDPDRPLHRRRAASGGGEGAMESMELDPKALIKPRKQH